MLDLDTIELFSIITNGTIFIAAFAVASASIFLFKLSKKFGGGILYSGFKSIGLGILIFSLGLLIDALNYYFILSFNNIFTASIFLIKGACFVVGAYIIVIGSKRTSEKLENL